MEMKISVIIPVYNSEKYIKKCLNSIVNQSYKNLEIIIINDGSIDNSKMICEEFCIKDSRIKLVNKENEGVSKARNVGIELATGELISFIDSDDWIDLKMYEKIIEAFEMKNIDVCIFNYSIIKKEEKIDNEVIEKPRKEFDVEALENASVHGYVWNKVYRASLIKNIRFKENISMCEDLIFNLEFSEKKQDIKYEYLEKCFYNYYQNDESAFHKKYNTDYSRLDVMESIINHFSKNGQEYIIEKKCEYIKYIKDLLYNNIKIGNIHIKRRYLNNLKKFVFDLKNRRGALRNCIKTILIYYYVNILIKKYKVIIED